jgi:hypothetical protein
MCGSKPDKCHITGERVTGCHDMIVIPGFDLEIVISQRDIADNVFWFVRKVQTDF